jgi:peroxiredoxin
LAEYSAEASRFRSAGAEVAAISVDDTSRSAALREQLKLKFTLLCDPDRAVVKSYGLLNIEEMGGIAYPAVFVIDRERVIRFRALETMARRTDVKELVGLVRSIVKGGAEAASEPRQRGIWPGEMFFRAGINMMLRGVRVPWK